ncbi:hypothetical protein DICVIV_08568 [Dictyocaulus viviparus]|uniref:Protein kinase domain-containing protein n=1 Tax=Dictyocaulus viviparus TaxID=29172 RepID=A0A0D8XSQ1_DICVI|nr:hypothetical protein DICVIV_08568 [Dictyocaulus viviparus]
MLQTNRNQEERKDVPRLLTRGEQIDEYIISGLISIGGFGQVYTGFHRTNHTRVAIKVESSTASIPLLRNEAACLHFLNSRHNPYGEESREPILRYITYGKNDNLKYLIMDHCGANLRELKRATSEDKFSMTTSLWIMERMMSALQFIHSHGWLHRYFINTDGSYKERKPTSPFHGTVRYASLNTHNRQDQCRWDDLWSVFYITIENMVGALPWRHISDKKKVAEMKTSCDFHDLEYGNETCMPRPLRMLAYHLYDAYREQESSFYATPPYSRIIREVEHELNQRHFYQNSPLDWELKQSQYTILSNYDHHNHDEKALPMEQPLFEYSGKRSYYCF